MLAGPDPAHALAWRLELPPPRAGELRDYLVEQQRAWLDCIARMATKAVDQRQFRRDLDAAQFAFQFHSIGLGFNFAYRLLDDADAPRRARLAFEQLTATAKPA